MIAHPPFASRKMENFERAAELGNVGAVGCHAAVHTALTAAGSESLGIPQSLPLADILKLGIIPLHPAFHWHYLLSWSETTHLVGPNVGDNLLRHRS